MKIEIRQDPFSPENEVATQKIIRTAEEARKKAKDRLTPQKSEVSVQVDLSKDTPFRTLHVGDTHFSHDDSQIGALDRAIEQAGEDGIMVTQGNLIDAVSDRFINTNTIRVAFTLDEQERIVENKLKPLVKENRLIAVDQNTCHEGWSAKKATHDPLPNMVGPETSILYTGGQAKFKQNGKLLGTLEVYHKGGQGNTKQSPEGSVRARYREIPAGHPDSPDVIIDGHMHNLVAAQDVYHDPVKGVDVVKTLGQIGAAKGTKENPDRFLIGLGVPPRDQPASAGEGLEVIWKKRRGSGKLVPYPVAGYDRANRVYDAEVLWENAQRTGNAEELHEAVLASEKDSLPLPRFNKEGSRRRRKDNAAAAEGKEAKAPLYKKISYDIPSSLPIRIQFVGGLRVGSGSFERSKISAILKEIEENPWAFVFATRRLINQGVPRQLDREEVLVKMTKLLSKSKNSLLGVMLTDELRKRGWVNAVKIKGHVKSAPIYPGDWLYLKSDIKGVPVIAPETTSIIKVGRTKYTLLLRDKLSHLTSMLNPFHGLTRIQQVWGIDADVLVGGHTEIVGWRTWMKSWGQLEIVVPGGFSEYIEKGIGNRVDSTEGGQGVILFPDEKAVFSFATNRDGVDMHEALWLQEGLRNMGTLEEVSGKLKKTRNGNNSNGR